jgi:hypothetical protein
LAVLLSSSFLRGEESNWPQFREPDANPVSAHRQLPERKSKTEKVEWSIEIPGLGWSSPVAGGKRVLAHSQIGPAQGLLTGFLHPLSALDHVVAIIAVRGASVINCC